MGCRLADVETQRPLELCSQIVFASRDLDLGRHAAGLGTGGVEVWRCAAGVQTRSYLPQEIWSSGGMLWAWGRGGVCLKSSGALKVRCRRVDVTMQRGMELWRCVAGV